MFQYGYLRLLAEKNGWPWRLESELLQETFNLPWSSREETDSYSAVTELGAPVFNHPPQLELLLKNQGTLREWFQPTDFGEKFLVERGHPVVVNVRGGDFRPRWLLKLKYYQWALSYLRDSEPRPIIVTDDLDYAKSILPNYEILHTKDDFSILYHAKRLVCSNSTYCWWAAFLGQHDWVVAPDGNWLEYPEERRCAGCFSWAIEKLRWKRLNPDGSLRVR
jgi:hypothetical protein